MKQVFLATSFSNRVDDAGLVQTDFRNGIEQLLQGLRDEAGVEVFCAIEDEGWRMNDTPPEQAVQYDLKKLNEADVMVAMMDEHISAGVQFEIGYCVGVGKPVILVIRRGEPFAYYNQGAVSAGWVTLITYDDIASLITQLSVAVNAPAEVLS